MTNIHLDRHQALNMQHPFQCIATVQPQTHNRSASYLLAACGPKLWSVALESGDVASEWSAVDAEVGLSDFLSNPESGLSIT